MIPKIIEKLKMDTGKKSETGYKPFAMES